MKSLLVFYSVFLMAFFCTESRAMDMKQFGEHAGYLVAGAMVLDAYDEICLFNGERMDVYLKDLDQEIKDKVGISWTEMWKIEEKQTGKNHLQEARQRAHRLINKFVTESNGCRSSKVESHIDKMKNDYFENFQNFQKTYAEQDGS